VIPFKPGREVMDIKFTLELILKEQTNDRGEKGKIILL